MWSVRESRQLDLGTERGRRPRTSSSSPAETRVPNTLGFELGMSRADAERRLGPGHSFSKRIPFVACYLRSTEGPDASPLKVVSVWVKYADDKAVDFTIRRVDERGNECR